jgi:hypothetical protein
MISTKSEKKADEKTLDIVLEFMSEDQEGPEVTSFASSGS